MSYNKVSMYDVDMHVAEIYDQIENQTEDVDLIQKLLANNAPIRILEPFCGTGRILLPLVIAGNQGVGIDRAKAMLCWAQQKIGSLPNSVKARIELINADVVNTDWPKGFDLVILGGNCLYELGTIKEQEWCIIRASDSLNTGGFIYLDNDHMEGILDEAWQKLDVDNKAFPTGTCEDGTNIQTERERIWFDINQRMVRYRRRTIIKLPDGETISEEYQMQCHLPSKVEMQAWLEKYDFTVEQIFGDRSGNPYTDTSNRAIFWARKN